ncbi:translation initiation factor 4E [Indivirus ILV1]|uniref:Translation initiation factor 4E n=1 Tax=Indivirus ILV1 TaxID=1977633 RepID=A0A1V0SCK9_9VIRU|nr:translation initiation factor 4E [Indivirus ILV1]
MSSTNEIVSTGGDIPLAHNFVLWCHDVQCTDWSLQSYQKLCLIKNVSEFWQVFNNFLKLGYKFYNFFLMKKDIDPTWEHEKNRNGGVCSFKIDINQSLDIFEELCRYMVCNSLTDSPSDINGISFSPKNNWAIIKIWNSNKLNDLSVTLNPELLIKYKDNSIKYKENNPEY